MIGSPPTSERRSIAGTLQLALLGLTIALAIIGAVGIAALYDARQRYEDRIAETSALEVAAANLLTSTVALEANLARPRSRGTGHFVASAARSLRRSAATVTLLARSDGVSRALAGRIEPARRTAATLAADPAARAARGAAARDLRVVRRVVPRLAGRQQRAAPRRAPWRRAGRATR